MLCGVLSRTVLCRKLHQAYTRVQAGNYSLTPLVGMELQGKTIGVLGTGAIGTEAARMFKVRQGTHVCVLLCSSTVQSWTRFTVHCCSAVKGAVDCGSLLMAVFVL